MSQWFPIISYSLEAKPELPLMIQNRRLEESYPIHGHDYYEMELIIEGSGTQWINNTNVPFEKGSLFLLSPESYHRVEIDTTVSLFSIHFPFWMAEKMGFEQIEHAYAAKLSPQEYQQLFLLLTALAQPEHAKLDYSVQELQATTMQILILLLRRGTVYSLSKPGRHLQQALKYIRDHHTNPALRIADVARICGLSTCYFSSLFHQTVGCRYADYLTDYRLRHACALLSSSHLSITEVAYEAGFSSLAHFFRSFKKTVGCTPTVYRTENNIRRV